MTFGLPHRWHSVTPFFPAARSFKPSGFLALPKCLLSHKTCTLSPALATPDQAARTGLPLQNARVSDRQPFCVGRQPWALALVHRSWQDDDKQSGE
jgi:hypothetical protein